MTDTKFCINCKHFNSDKADCNRPIGISLVYGTNQYKNLKAAVERTLDCTGCGTGARYFEPKE